MKPTFNDKLLAYLVLFSGLAISGVAEYYSIMGLIAIYPAAFIPIVIMGIVLGFGKISGTVWLKQNWEFAPWFLKTYILPAIVILMLITSLGVFGYLSKAHSDQSLVSGDVQSKIAVYDEKIKTAKDNIDANRKALKQMDEAVDQVMGRSQDEKGADKAVAIRRGQQKERARLQAEIATEQKTISQLSEERAPIAAEVRKVEAEVGPIKYIAHLLYGENPDANILEKAVIWVTVLIVIVLDPLAVVLLLASQFSFQRFRRLEEEDEFLLHKTVPAYEPDDGPINEDALAALRARAAEELPTGEVIDKSTLISDIPETEEEVEAWNRMIASAEAELAKANEKKFVDSGEHPKDTFEHEKEEEPTINYQVLDDDSEVDYYMTSPKEDAIITHTPEGIIVEDSAGTDLLEVHPDEGDTANIPDVERPGDYVTPPAPPAPPPPHAIDSAYVSIGGNMYHHKAYDSNSKDAYDAVARHTESAYVQNEEQNEADTKWKEITSVSEDKYQEAAKRNKESN